MHALHERDLIYIFPFPFLRKPAYLVASKKWVSHVWYVRHVYANYCQRYFQPHFVYLFSSPTSRVYLHRNWCVCSQMVHKCDKKSIERDLLVNVNNSSITIEFLNMILSRSHVIFMSSRFRLMYGFYSLAPTDGGKFLWNLLRKSKMLKGIFWDFLRNSFWFGSPSHEQKVRRFLCWYLSVEPGILI